MADNDTDPDIINNEYVRQQVEDLIADGFADNEEIVEIVDEEIIDDDGCERSLSEDSLRRLGRLVRKLAAKHRRREAPWPSTTDCDRLDAAFDALCQRGVLACQYVGFDQDEGHDIMLAMVPDSPEAHGYAFYTTRATSCARDDGKLFINYATLAGTDEAAAEVGRQVVEALREAGLQVEWDGDPDKTILVTGLKWQCRRRSGMTVRELHREIEEHIASGLLDPKAAVTVTVWWGERAAHGSLVGTSMDATGRMNLYVRRDRSTKQKGLSEEDAVE